MKFKFQANYLPVLARFAAKQDIRYYMNGIHVAPAPVGLYLVATDGHCMVVIHDLQGEHSGVPHPGAIRITPGLVAAAKSRHTLPLFVLLDGKRLSVAPDFSMEHNPLEVFVQAGDPLVDGVFPAWQRNMPDFNTLLPGALTDGGGVNLKLLARFTEVDKRYPGISMWRKPDDHQAIIVQVHAMQELLGLIMPLRCDPPEPRRKMMLDHFPNNQAKAAEPQHVPV